MSPTAPPALRLGMLTPSSNTVLEPLTAAMLAGLPDVTAHFARFPVTQISLDESALGQFDPGPMLAAADLLADARVDVICWNGTSSGWLGFGSDHALCEAIEARTGIPAASAVLALNEALSLTGARRIAFVTPYLDEIQERILATYAGAGFEVVAERHLQDRGNYSFSTYSEARIADLCREVAAAGPEAIAVFCTNFRGAGIAEAVEAETGIPVYDTVSTALWGAMRRAGGDPARIRGWGRLFGHVG
ncbi:MAG: aspartate/glutamate racemase family protein [Pseudomonadota bacterium]